MLPVGINFFHILVSLPESTNTLRSDFLSPISQKNKLRLGCEGAALSAEYCPNSRACCGSSPSPRCAKSQGPAKVRVEEALRPVESEAGPLLRATGSPQTQPGRRSRKKPGTGPKPGPRQPRASPARPPFPSFLPPPGGAGRGASTKDSNFLAGAGPPRQLPV